MSFVHAALLYPDADRLRDVLAGFAREASAADEPLLTVLSPSTAELVADVVDVAGGAVTALPALEVGGNPSCLIPVLERWLADQDRPARIVSEAIWPERDPADLAECLRHEALVNVAFADAPVRVLCPFDVAHLPGDAIAGARMTHPRLLTEDGLLASDDYGDPVELARGERWPQAGPVPPVSELPFDGDLHALRRRLVSDPLLADLGSDRREDLVVAVNEAAGNAVRHGDGTCRVRVWQDGDRVVAEVVTPSPIADPLAGRRRPEPTEANGRGLWLIGQLCDLSEVRSGPDGSSVRMHVGVA